MLHRIVVTYQFATRSFYFGDHHFDRADRLARFWSNAEAYVVWRRYEEIKDI
jgi:hypothetical protein